MEVAWVANILSLHDGIVLQERKRKRLLAEQQVGLDSFCIWLGCEYLVQKLDTCCQCTSQSALTCSFVKDLYTLTPLDANGRLALIISANRQWNAPLGFYVELASWVRPSLCS